MYFISSAIFLEKSIRTTPVSFAAMYLFIYLLHSVIVSFHIMSVWSMEYTIRYNWVRMISEIQDQI